MAERKQEYPSLSPERNKQLSESLLNPILGGPPLKPKKHIASINKEYLKNV